MRATLRFIFGGVLILALATPVAAFFILQIDLNDYRPEFEREMNRFPGIQCFVGTLSPAFDGRLKLRIQNFRCQSSQTGETLLTSEFVDLYIQWQHLTRRVIRISEFRIVKPLILIRRNPNAFWNWQIMPSGQEEATGAPNGKLIASGEGQKDSNRRPYFAQSILFQRIVIRDGRIRYLDESFKPSFELMLDRVLCDLQIQPGGDAVIIGGSAGLITRDEKEFSFRVIYEPKLDELKIHGVFRDERAVFEGRVLTLHALPKLEGSMAIHQLDLNSVVPADWFSREHVTGLLTARFDFAAIGTHPDTLRKSLVLEGNLDLRQGSIKNQNFFRMAFERIIPLEGVLAGLRETSHPVLQALLRGDDLPFERIDSSVRIQDGVAVFNDLFLKYTHYLAEVSGNWHVIPGQVDFSVKLIVLEELSRILAEEVRELNTLTNPQGRMILPFLWKGSLPDGMIVIDEAYLNEQLVRFQGGQMAAELSDRMSHNR